MLDVRVDKFELKPVLFDQIDLPFQQLDRAFDNFFHVL